VRKAVVHKEVKRAAVARVSNRLKSRLARVREEAAGAGGTRPSALTAIRFQADQRILELARNELMVANLTLVATVQEWREWINEDWPELNPA
jgi:hypothetical protein